MCNRYIQKGNYAHLDREFSIQSNLFTDLKPELFPMRDALIVRPRQDAPGREGAVARWGLVPSLAADPKAGRQMTNARSETVATKPSYRSAFKARRCLIPATGFCEFAKADRRRYEISFADHRIFAFAGLWESWPKGDEPLETFTMLTGEPNDLVSKYHDRMPTILHPEDYDLWLTGKPDELDVLFEPFPAESMTVKPMA